MVVTNGSGNWNLGSVSDVWADFILVTNTTQTSQFGVSRKAIGFGMNNVGLVSQDDNSNFATTSPIIAFGTHDPTYTITYSIKGYLR